MRGTAALVASVLWLSGCGDGEPEATTQAVAGKGIRRIVITNEGGGLELETAQGGGVRIRGSITETATRDAVLRIKGAGGALKLIVPDGLDLVANQKRGGITLAGRWGTIELHASGDVRVEAAVLAGGSIETSKGAIHCRSGSLPKVSLRCKSIGGDVYVGVPDAYRGLIQLSSDAGAIDLTPHPRVRARRDGAGNSILAFAGAWFSKEEHADLPADKRPGIWASSTRGKVTFRLEITKRGTPGPG